MASFANYRCQDEKLSDEAALYYLGQARNRYYEHPGAFHVDTRIVHEHCHFHQTKSYLHRGYRLFVRQLAIDVMLYGRAFLIHRNYQRELDKLVIEAEFTDIIGETDYAPTKNKNREKSKRAQVSKNIKNKQ